jgi:adenylate cyclase
MVGAFAKGVAQDEKNTPYGLMYGIEVHANALNTILNGNFLVYAPDWLNVTVLLVCCIVVVFLASRIPALYSSIVTLVFVIAIFVISMFVFEGQSVIFDFPTPSIAMLFTLLGVVGYRGMTDERDKKQIRETFGKYVSPTVVEQLVDNPPELGGVDKELTVLFSDIRGFTTLSENMSPQELVNHLNVYLTAMTDIILAYNGTLDKYVGDEVMCFWGAPIPMQDHAELACKCALRQMEKLAELNESWPESRRIRIGIGLNSGIMTVGNMGSPTRMNYTLMGDNVNLGARLEGTNKEYGTGIIVSEFTYGLVRDRFVFRELDNIRVKGKNKPVLMYELVDCIGPNEPPLPIGKTKGREGQ